MMLWIGLICAGISALSIAFALLYLVLPLKVRLQLLPHLVSYATGTLLGAAFLALLPHSIELAGIDNFHAITLTILLGVLVFFVMEKLVLWRHCHHDNCEAHHIRGESEKAAGVTGPLIVLGDFVHNLIHGVLIAASFMVDFDLGIVTAFAVMAHQVPQEIGNIGVLLHSGYGRKRAILFNALSGIAAPIGGILGYFGFADVEWSLPYMLAIAVSSSLYIAVADLIPGLHKRVEFMATVEQVLLISAGVGTIYYTHALLH